MRRFQKRRFRRYKRIKRYRSSFEKKAIFTVISGLLIFSIFVVMTDAKARPLLRSIAENEAKTVVLTAIGDAVAEVIADNDIKYEDLTEIIYDENKNIKSINTNTNGINLVESQIVDCAVKHIEKNKKFPISLSVGSLFGNELASGRGPSLNFYVSFSSNTQSMLENEFVAAGINQTKHLIQLRVNTDIYISLTGDDIETSVDNVITIAETIIIGSIPNAYVRNP